MRDDLVISCEQLNINGVKKMVVKVMVRLQESNWGDGGYMTVGKVDLN